MQDNTAVSESDEPASDFIRDMIDRDRAAGKHGGSVVTRFPPEPNGYLHIGHAKSICLNFGLARQYGGRCHLRFDDTNPTREGVEYADAIIRDVQWLGWDWGEHLYYASDYFERLYECAMELIRRGMAYVCDLDTGAFKEYRGVPTRPGRESPGRQRSIEDNIDLFQRMRAGEFDEGRYVLRAKIDMASPNLHMRDPVIYRIKKAEHHRTGARWVVYPMYDFAHGLSDSFEGITHSVCTLEFEVHRPLYDWILDALDLHHPQQIEFARLNLTYTVMSKRKLLELVESGAVDGWDDPRLPTLCGLRRRGYTPSSIRTFCRKIGVTKFDGYTDTALLEHCIREELNRAAPRAMAVLDPLKVVIENYPEDRVETLEGINNPEDSAAGTRSVPFSRELYVERSDFMEDPPKKFFRLAPGREVRLRYGYFIACREAIKDSVTGRVVELRCTYDPETRGGHAPDGRKVRGTLHWVSAAHAVRAKVRLYDRLFTEERPDDLGDGRDWTDALNPDAKIEADALIEPSLAQAKPGDRLQFERQGYFYADPVESRPGAPVFNRIVSLKGQFKP